MTTLLLQTFLLLLGSFFLGCAVACIFRRMFFAVERPVEIPKAVAPRPAAVVTAAPVNKLPSVAPAETARFERALSGSASEVATSRTSPAPARVGPVVEVEPPAPKLAPAAPAAPQATVATQATQPSATAPVRPEVPASTSAPQPAQVPAPPPSASAAAVTTAAALAAAAAAAARPAAPAATAPAAPATTVLVGPAAFEAAARAAAAATAATASPAPAPVEPKAVPAAASAATVVPAAPAATVAAKPADDLTRIRAIDAEMQSRLNKLGVRRYDEIAAWVSGDVNRMSQTLGFAGRIEQENWIEQAQILAKGDETEYSRRRAQGMATPSAAQSAPVSAPAAAPTPATPFPAPAAAAPQPAAKPVSDDPNQRPFGVASQSQTADVSAAAAAAAIAAAAATATRAPSPAPAAAATGDRLHRILGINADAERVLHANGVTRFAQIAAWSPADVSSFRWSAWPARPHRPGELDRASQGSDQTCRRGRCEPAGASRRCYPR